ncbi:AAA family ATPase [Paenibacillus turicensis]|uniref:AAA family ATPase n=1 Tax=Paenibacillus turicensis TaxID=160487 RepID=UPI003D29B458
MSISKLYVRGIRLELADVDLHSYPYHLPFIQALKTLNFNNAVSFIVGENGSGKSTLLEAIAVNYGFNPEGGSKNFNFSTNNTHALLDQQITLIKGVKRPKDGYFLRAESFYNVASEIEKLDQETPGLYMSYGGKSLHHQSHGESFMSLIMHRFRGSGLYILDEPEAALSPARQFALISRMHDLVQQGSQFIIATHSPILMAFPNADVFVIRDEVIEQTTYDQTDHYILTKSFLNHPERILKELMD